jgi:hypothetical protein
MFGSTIAPDMLSSENSCACTLDLWLLLVSIQAYPMPTCLGLKGVVVVIVNKKVIMI